MKRSKPLRRTGFSRSAQPPTTVELHCVPTTMLKPPPAPRPVATRPGIVSMAFALPAIAPEDRTTTKTAAEAAERGSTGAIRGAGLALGANAQQRTESEIEREVERIRRADNDLAEAVEMLWDRLGRAGVLAPPPEMKPAPGTTVETAHSVLGNELQNRAFAIQAKAERLHELMRALCL